MIDPRKYQALIYDIVGSAMEVHSVLKDGLLEAVYQAAMCEEMKRVGLQPFPEQELPVYYKGVLLDKTYRMDIVCEDVVIELKAVKEILPEHRAQLFNYLRLTKKPIGLLINFGEKSLHTERYAFDEESNTVFLFHPTYQR